MLPHLVETIHNLWMDIGAHKCAIDMDGSGIDYRSIKKLMIFM